MNLLNTQLSGELSIFLLKHATQIVICFHLFLFEDLLRHSYHENAACHYRWNSMVFLSVHPLVVTVSLAKIDEPIKMLFGLWTREA